MNPFRLQFHIAALLKFTLICSAFLALFHWSGVDRIGDDDGPEAMLWPVGMAMLCTLSFMIPKLKNPRCRSCGQKCAPTWNPEPEAICAACRVAKLAPQQRSRVAAWWVLTLIGLFLALSFLLIGPVSGLLRFHLDWPAYAAAGLGLFAVLLVITFVTTVVRLLVGSWRMGRPAHALKAARTCAGEEGDETSFGRVTVHLLGTKADPSPMLKGQLDTCRGRLEALVGEPVETERPLSVLAFGSRDSLGAFCRRAVLYSGNLDGVYIPWPARTIAITTEFAPYRLADRERIARTLLTYDLLDAHVPGGTPMWLQVGIASLVACGGDEDEPARLNRRMLASLARGTDLDAPAFFRPSARGLIRLVRNWQDHGHFAVYTQLLGQSASVGEYLAGRSAPAEHREQFLRFLKDLAPKTAPEEAFARHFGYGFEGLLERWRAWVAGQGAGTHSLPPISVRDAILERVVPVIESRGAPLLDRIQAIREMGKAGYAFGADALIERLAADSTLPKEELVWSLEAISGLAIGDDVRRWRRWWDGLSPDATGLAPAAASSFLVASDPVAG